MRLPAAGSPDIDIELILPAGVCTGPDDPLDPHPLTVAHYADQYYQTCTRRCQVILLESLDNVREEVQHG